MLMLLMALQSTHMRQVQLFLETKALTYVPIVQ
jgi:hypothetical protein